MRIVLVVRDQALRIASAVVRALDFADRVTILNLDNNPETTVLAIEAGADVNIIREWSRLRRESRKFTSSGIF